MSSVMEDLYQSIFDQTTAAEAVKEATAFPTVPSGTYRLEIQSKEITPAGDKSPWPGRMMVHVKAVLFDPQTGEKKKTEFFDLSPVENRTQSGRIDGPYQLWCHAISALGMTGRTNREIYEVLDTIPYKSFVAESFKVIDENTGEPKWTSPRNEEERTEYRKEGADARNFVRSLSKLG